MTHIFVFRRCCIAIYVVLLILAPSAHAASLDAENPTEVTKNLLEVIQSEDEALAYVDRLRGLAQQASGARKEPALVQLADTIRLYLENHAIKPAARNQLLREAIDSYSAASGLALEDGRIRYSRQIADLAYALGDKSLLDESFSRFLANLDDERGRYVALIDYAAALARFDDWSANVYYDLAIHMRRPRDSVEAHVRFAQYLVDTGRPQDALDVLNRFDAADRTYYLNVALFRQGLMHSLRLNTSEVDAEVSELRQSLDGAWGLGPIPKLTANAATRPENTLGFAEVYAFAHANNFDDSRGTLGNQWLISPSGSQWNRTIVNAVEVVYNEARSEPHDGRVAVAWSMRNRALINMNGCDFYPGAEGHGNVTACRIATPKGPQGGDYEDTNKRWSCVVHGGTATVGATHSQMNDGHVPIATTEPTGLFSEVFWVMNGQTPDLTSANTPSGTFRPILLPPWVTYNVVQGNPAGAQEWRSINYCAANSSCKVRLGNVGGNLPDPGNLCPASGGLTTDNFFWGRKP